MTAGTPDPSFEVAKPTRPAASDLLLGAGGAYLLSVPLLGLLVGNAGARAWPLALVWGLSVLVNASHFGATLLRVYGERAERRKYALFAVWVTAPSLELFWLGVHDTWVGSAMVTTSFGMHTLAFTAIWISATHSAQYLGVTHHFVRQRGEEGRLPTYLVRATLAGNGAFVIPALIFTPGLLGGELGITRTPGSAWGGTSSRRGTTRRLGGQFARNTETHPSWAAWGGGWARRLRASAT